MRLENRRRQTVITKFVANLSYCTLDRSVNDAKNVECPLSELSNAKK